MSVIISDMKMPMACYACEFGKRWDNGSTMCERKPTETPVLDGTGRPNFCPLEEQREIVICGECEYGNLIGSGFVRCKKGSTHYFDWFCADGEKKKPTCTLENPAKDNNFEAFVVCKNCKHFDKEYGVCKHPIAIKNDVGEEDSCNLWWGRNEE